MSNIRGAIEVARPSNRRFTNANDGDIIFYSRSNGQAIHIGVSSNAPSQIRINRDSFTINASNTSINGTFAINGLTRIDGSGVLSNLTVLPNSTSVNIDASRITTGAFPIDRFPYASIYSPGIVQLANSTQSHSLTLGATASSVHATWDLANRAYRLITSYSDSQINILKNIDAFNIISGVINQARLPSATYTHTGIIQLTSNYTFASENLVPTAQALSNAYTDATQYATTTSKGLVIFSSNIQTNASNLAAPAAHTAFLSNAVTIAQQTANAAIPRAGGTMTGDISAPRFISYTSNQSPLQVTSSNLVLNLNTQYLNSKPGAFYQDASNLLTGVIHPDRLPYATETTPAAIKYTNSIFDSNASNIASTGAVAAFLYTQFTQYIDTSYITSGVLSLDRLPKTAVNQEGVVALVDTIDSDSLSNAPTARALSNTYMLATSNIHASRITDGIIDNYHLNIADKSGNYGITALSDAVDSLDNTIAATPLAVKFAYDLATVASNAAFSNVHASRITDGIIDNQRLNIAGLSNAYGITTLSDATDSSSSSNAATPFAVKLTYDLATTASNAAFSNIYASRITDGIIDNQRINIADTSGQYGITSLSDAVDSLSSSNAATPFAVKLTYDIATTASNAAFSNIHVSRITDGIIDNQRLNIAGLSNAYGITSLSDATDSTSSSNAATPFAVKIAYDLASIASNAAFSNVHALRITNGIIDNARLNIADTLGQYGITTLSDTIDSTSSSNAATSYAVKFAYDLATIASNAAFSNIHASRITDGVIENARINIAGINNTYGITTLSDAIDSISSSNAATPLAVKFAYDLATVASNAAFSNIDASRITTGIIDHNRLPISQYIDLDSSSNIASSAALSNVYALAAFSNIHASRITNGIIDNQRLNIAGLSNAYGITTLSDAIDSISSSNAATSYAVKFAYDLATVASNAAFSNVHALRITNGIIDNARLNIADTSGQYGITTLSDSISSSNTQQAATSFAVKRIYDILLTTSNAAYADLDATRITSGTFDNARLNIASESQYGITQLSSSIDSTSNNQAATSLAVKTVYDIATSNIDTSRITTGILDPNRLPISDSINSQSTSNIASSAALSNIYAIATTASNAAFSNIDASRITTGIIYPDRLPISDSITSPSTSNIASSLAVKTTYDLANAALPRSGGTMTGVLTAAQSTSNTPSISFSPDPSTGLYANTLGEMGFAVGGIPILILDSNGGVLSGRLQVSGIRVAG